MTTPTQAIRRWWYLTRVSWTMRDLPTADWRATKVALRGSIDDAAADVGMAGALADLGSPRDLALQYIAATDGWRRPQWTSGIIAAGVAILAWWLAVFFYAIGATDALTDLGGAQGGAHVILGIAVRPYALSSGFGIEFHPTVWAWIGVLCVAAVFAIGARAWRVVRPGAPARLEPGPGAGA